MKLLPVSLSYILILTMFSALARAFVPVATTSRGPAARILTPAPRFLASDAPDTSIVDICTDKIRTALEATDVKVTGAYDDPNGSHISIEVVSSQFQGKRPVQRQQLVYKAIWEELQGPVHAVDAMVCKTPEEA